MKSLLEYFNYNLKCVSKDIVKCKKVLGALCSHSSLNIDFFSFIVSFNAQKMS